MIDQVKDIIATYLFEGYFEAKTNKKISFLEDWKSLQPKDRLALTQLYLEYFSPKRVRADHETNPQALEDHLTQLNDNILRGLQAIKGKPNNEDSNSQRGNKIE